MIPDINLLCDVLENQASSYDYLAQKEFAKWILRKLSEQDPNIKFKYSFDKFGNLYVTKGKSKNYPCIVAHLDSVHDDVENRKVVRIDDFIVAFNLDTGCQTGCGADDKVGVAIAIEMFKRNKEIKLFFPVDEEIGALGSKNCNINFFKDCCFMIQPDRNMYTQKDYINFTNGIYVTSTEFDNEIQDILDKYDYKRAEGTFTDIGELVKRCRNKHEYAPCAFNLSCYMNAHTDHESVFIPLYTDAINLVNDVIEKMSYRKWEVTDRKDTEHDILPYEYDYDYYSFEKRIFASFLDEQEYQHEVLEEITRCKNMCSIDDVDADPSQDCFYCTKCNKILGQDYIYKFN